MAHELDDPVKTLGDILRGIGATVTVDTDRLSRSTLYDFDYHSAVIACVFAGKFGKRVGQGRRCLLVARGTQEAGAHRNAHYVHAIVAGEPAQQIVILKE